MAVANYRDAYGVHPPAFVVGPDGRPWHSWRTLILPYLERRDLYDAYNFAQPWDGPDNRALIGRIPATFASPDRGPAPKDGMTSYVAVVGPETAFPGPRATAIEDIPDGLSETLLAIEVAASGIPWTAPRDLPFGASSFRVNDPAGPGRGPGSRIGGARVAFLDGSVHHLHDDYPADVLRALVTARGGEAVDRTTGRESVIFGPSR